MGSAFRKAPPQNAGKYIGKMELRGAYGPCCNCCHPYKFITGCGCCDVCGSGPTGPEWTAAKPGFQKILAEVDGLVKDVPQECGCCGPHGDRCYEKLQGSWLSSANQYLQTHGMVADLESVYVKQGESGGQMVLQMYVYMLKGDMVGQPTQQTM